ncbi:SDR family oxidoreductase [Halopseudomonas pachastrellae]|nr:SDR family oxidoreductase [Halopseudomonas pachastrellae]
MGVSNTVRAAVANWAKTLSTELAADGITVNNVLPGLTQTPRLDSLIAGGAKNSGRSVEQVAEGMANSIPVGRFAKPAEFANAVGFLASPAAAYINGINLPVDGGRTGNL